MVPLLAMSAMVAMVAMLPLLAYDALVAMVPLVAMGAMMARVPEGHVLLQVMVTMEVAQTLRAMAAMEAL